MVGISGSGIYLGLSDGATVVNACNVQTVGGYGIVAVVVADSTVTECGAAGITAHAMRNCSGQSVGTDVGLNASVASNCYGGSGATTTGSTGFVATGCTGNSGTGTALNAVNAADCTAAIGGAAVGGAAAINATVAVGCTGTAPNNGVVASTGVSAAVANNCTGRGGPPTG